MAVDKMTVDKMTVDKMTVDKMAVDRITHCHHQITQIDNKLPFT
jgi:hypothetical protein